MRFNSCDVKNRISALYAVLRLWGDSDVLVFPATLEAPASLALLQLDLPQLRQLTDAVSLHALL